MCVLRTVSFVLSLACLAVGAHAQSPAPARAATAISAWPQFRATPQLSGVSSSNLPETLKVIWTFDMGDVIETSAAIVDGTVFAGSAAGELVALDLESGSVRWKYRTGELGESSPAVANGVVYIGDLTGVLHAVDVHSGKAMWTF